MTGLARIPPQPQQQPIFIPTPYLLDPSTSAPWLLQPSADTSTTRKSRKSSKRHHSRRRKKERSRKSRLGAYVLQLIGLVCLVLAAVKSFEPLTGVGFTLIVMGYKGGFRDDGGRSVIRGVGDITDEDVDVLSFEKKRSGKSKKKRKREEGSELLKEEVEE